MEICWKLCEQRVKTMKSCRFILKSVRTKGPKGRGSKLTFLSKNTFNKIIYEIGDTMKKTPVKSTQRGIFQTRMAEWEKLTDTLKGRKKLIRFKNIREDTMVLK